MIYAAVLEAQPVLLVEHEDAPTYHDATVAYLASLEVRPAWVMHPASQVERMLDMVAVGSGIGWLNQWQAVQPRSRRRRDPAAAADRAIRRVPPRVARRR